MLGSLHSIRARQNDQTQTELTLAHHSPRGTQVQVFISSTADLNEFGEGLHDWMSTDAVIREWFWPFYYTRHTPSRDEPRVDSEVDEQLRRSRLFIGLLSTEPGTRMRRTFFRRVLRQQPETYVEHEHHKARRLRLATRRFRHGTGRSNGVWELHFQNHGELLALAHSFLIDWIGSRINQRSQPSVVEATTLVGLLALTGIFVFADRGGLIDRDTALSGIVISLAASIAVLVFAFGPWRRP